MKKYNISKNIQKTVTSAGKAFSRNGITFAFVPNVTTTPELAPFQPHQKNRRIAQFDVAPAAVSHPRKRGRGTGLHRAFTVKGKVAQNKGVR